MEGSANEKEGDGKANTRQGGCAEKLSPTDCPWFFGEAPATAAGLQVFDVRPNDLALHVIPPDQHPKRADYVECIYSRS